MKYKDSTNKQKTKKNKMKIIELKKNYHQNKSTVGAQQQNEYDR